MTAGTAISTGCMSIMDGHIDIPMMTKAALVAAYGNYVLGPKFIQWFWIGVP